MNVVHLMGGLGNQLFQINFGYFLKKNYNLDVVFNSYLCEKNYFTSKVLKWKIHNFNADIFFTNFESFSSNNILPAISSKFGLLNNYSYFCKLEWPTRTYQNYFGYFQDKNRLDKIWFQNNLIIKNVLINSNYNFDNSMVVHIRLTDSENLENNIKYYNKVFQKYRDKNFICITDDIFQTKNLLVKNKISNYKISNLNASEDFHILLKAKEIAIAPSTFSWWGAKLNNNLKKVVINKNFYDKIGFSTNVELDVIE